MSKKTKLSSKNAAETRLGEIRMMNCGEIAFIVNYADYLNITVQFKNTGELVKTTYQHFKNGNVKSHFTPSVYGVGIIGNEKSKDENGETIKSYSVWQSMLCRCYSGEYQKNHPTYKDCYVCEEWHNYSNFKKWYDDNYYKIEGERMALDKDILIKGNKIYSPQTCVFVPRLINNLFTKRQNERGLYPIGVEPYKDTNKFISIISETHRYTKTKRTHLGIRDTIEEAFNLYKVYKEKLIKDVADEYKNDIPKNLYYALYNYKVEITD